MSKRLLILGAGGHGRVIADAALLAGFTEVGFLDDRPVTMAPPLQVVGASGDFEAVKSDWPDVIIGIGDNAKRAALAIALKPAGGHLATVTHPSAVVSATVSIGGGVFVGANAVVGVGAKVGDNCIVNTSASIDHDCELGFAVHISPGCRLGGNVEVGDRSWIGIGATVRHGIRIGKDVIVAAGAVVVADIADGVCVAGVPAKPMQRRSPGRT